MNYQRIYDYIIERAKSENRKKFKGIYYEQHHIIPTCLGGSDKKENKVLLTAREHFICHKLLVEIYPEDKSLFFALFMLMYAKNKYQNRDYKISSREYERIKEINSKIISEKFSGNKHPNFGKIGKLNPRTGVKSSNETKNKISIGNTGKIRTDYQNKENSKRKKKYYETHTSPMKNKKFSEEVIKVISYGNKKAWEDEEIRNKYVNSAKNRKKVCCPVCGKIIDSSTSKIWHFENCGRTESLRKNYKSPSNESRLKTSNTLKNKPMIKCDYCDFETNNIGLLRRWHNENCKYNFKNQ